jgi:hypothetical protein
VPAYNVWPFPGIMEVQELVYAASIFCQTWAALRDFMGLKENVGRLTRRI